MAAYTLPTREQEQELHRRLLAGDKTAPADLANAYHVALLQYLRRRNSRRITDDLLSDAAFQTWSSLCQKPLSFTGEKSLWSFLRMSAQNDLRNVLAKEGRLRRRFKTGENVEEWPDAGIKEVDDGLGAMEAVRREILPIVEKGLTAIERRCLELYLSGQKKTAAFAAELGIAEQSKAEQEAAVKKMKDKLKLRIKRARRDHGNTP